MKTFSENLAGMPGIDGIAKLERLDSNGNLVATIENKAGSQGSLKVYHDLLQRFGSEDTLGVARSNLIQRIAKPARSRGPGRVRRTPFPDDGPRRARRLEPRRPWPLVRRRARRSPPSAPTREKSSGWTPKASNFAASSS